MKLIYVNKDLIKTININFKEFCNYIDNIINYNVIGKGTYCSCYKITNNIVLKVYTRADVYDEKYKCFITEINNEIKFIKDYTYLPYIANTYFIASNTNHDIYILQELLQIKKIVNIEYNDFLTNIDYFIKLLDINIKLLNFNIVNIDIKLSNVGFDTNHNLKIFDFNLLEKFNNVNLLLNLYDKYDYYYLHSVNNIIIKNIISYSIAILILESFSSNNECDKYLYKPKDLVRSKFVLLYKKKKLLTEKLHNLLYNCFQGKCTPNMLFDKLLVLYNN